MTLISTFIWGFSGSLAVEIVTFCQVFYSQPIEIPERYKSIVFWIVRFSLALVGGGLAVAYEIDKPILAANIGAATPLIIQTLAQGLRPSAAPVAQVSTVSAALTPSSSLPNLQTPPPSP